MDNISKTTNKINELYSDLSYFDQYGGSIIMFIVLLIVLFVAVSYSTIMKNIQPIKDDWPNQRCKPQVLPFAGLINKPDNASTVEFTGDNFAYCMQNILTNITGYALEPITYMTHSIKELFSAITEVVQYIRVMLASIRNNMINIAQEVLGRIANIMAPIQQILIAFKDSMGKVQGVLTAGLYTSLGAYYALKALLGAIAQFIITILIVLSALILAMWIIPFTWPVAISMTAVFISITIPLAIIVAFMTEVLHVRTSFSIPGAPSRPRLSACFDKNTALVMNDGSTKFIKNVNVGDILMDNNIITSKMALDSKDQIMYNISGVDVSGVDVSGVDVSGVVVSGSHRIKYDNEWIFVSEHPCAREIKTYNEPLLYCLNTSKKYIEVNDEIYMDWDELNEVDINDILRVTSSADEVDIKSANIFEEQDLFNIHKTFDGGFNGKTEIPMNDGSLKHIEDVLVGDMLSNGIKVFGIVEINGDTLEQISYNLGEETVFIGGPNLNICDIMHFKNLKLNKLENRMKSRKLYHLITEEKYFHVGNNNIKIYHYNSNIELLLDGHRENYYL
jgi:hypothetical protein